MARVLRIRRLDLENSWVLLNVVQSGQLPLDVDILATEGSYSYFATIKQEALSKELPRAILWTIFRKILDIAYVEDVKDVEMVSSVVEEKQITLTWRRNISGIAQRIGTLDLEYDQKDEHPIELFDWTTIAAQAASDAERASDDRDRKYASQREEAEKLKSQLEDFIRAKQEHENELLNKFRILLNNKKLKIRDQQRLLAGAKTDPQAAAQVQALRNNASRTRAGGSKSTKRNASGDIKVEEANSPNEDEIMGIMSGEDNGGVQSTPDRSETNDTDDEELFEAAPASRGKQAVEQDEANGTSSKVPAEQPPPIRNLPFASRPLSMPAGNEEVDYEETDDEL